MNSPRRRIVVFTGSRSEYGLLYPILRAIAADERLEVFVVAAGAHLENSLGGTLAEIEADGFHVHATVAIDGPDDTLLSTTRSIGARLQGLASALDSIGC